MEYNITLTQHPLEEQELLPMGGANPAGQTIQVGRRYLLKNGRPWFPVMGEMHFSRNPKEYWEEDLLKMKAAGITVAASYLFWIHHEEQEGVFRWDNSRDLRTFVKLCKKHGLYFFVRLGPWVHGECRNGGHPDWVYEKCPRVRCDEEPYLFYVKRYYQEVAKQLEGLFYKDGGPVVGIQVENELIRDPEHLKTLKNLAVECGMEAPVYTVTGWGHHGGTRFPQDEFVPMFGGYPEAPWEQHTRRLKSSMHYMFRKERNDADIGTDVLKGKEEAQWEGAPDLERYPFATCETGSGIPISYHRRPVIQPGDTAAMTLAGLGSGINFLGYFMFKGGCNPKENLTAYNETKDTGYLNNFPKLCNDFQAPISEFGEIREQYKVLKRFNLFLKDYGEEFARTCPCFPDVQPETEEDVKTLRVCARYGESGGFLFVNNYVRLKEMPEKKDFSLKLLDGRKVLEIPRGGLTVPKDSFFFFPFSLTYGKVKMASASAQPLLRTEDSRGIAAIFMAVDGIPCEYILEEQGIEDVNAGRGEAVRTGGRIHIRVPEPGLDSWVEIRYGGGKLRLLTMTQEQADCCYKPDINGRERIVVSEDELVCWEDHLTVGSSRREKRLWILEDALEGQFQEVVRMGRDQKCSVVLTETDLSRDLAENFAYLKTDREDLSGIRQWNLEAQLPELEEGEDVILVIRYTGDVAHLYLGDRLIADDFYKGTEWRIGLKRFQNEWNKMPLRLQILPMKPEEDVYLEGVPKVTESTAQVLEVRAEFKSAVRMEEADLRISVTA